MTSFKPLDTLTVRSGKKKILRLEVSRKKNNDKYLYAEIQDMDERKTMHIMIDEADSKDVKDFVSKHF